MSTYPITEQRSLGDPDRVGWLRRRVRSDLPRPAAHQVLVYRIDGRYVLDRDKMRATDEQVLAATHVSIVDTRRETPVEVRLQIPSADASTFDVSVTFICTVTEPVTVVGSGIDARDALWGYLQQHSRFAQLGLEHAILQINDFRRHVSAQVQAYFTVRPPAVAGISVSLGTVTVDEAQDRAKYEEAHREKALADQLARQELEYEQRKKTAEVIGGQNIEDFQQDHSHRKAGREQRHTQNAAEEAGRHRRDERERQAAFDRREYSQNMEIFGLDPRQMLMAAFASGQIDAQTLAAKIRELDDHTAAVEREERQALTAAEREDAREDRADRREEERWHRDEERQHRKEERDDARRREQEIRQDEREKLHARIELLKKAADSGHLDMVNIQADKLFAEVVGVSPAAIEDDTRPELSVDAAAALPRKDEDAEIRLDEADD